MGLCDTALSVFTCFSVCVCLCLYLFREEGFGKRQCVRETVSLGGKKQDSRPHTLLTGLEENVQLKRH